MRHLFPIPLQALNVIFIAIEKVNFPSGLLNARVKVQHLEECSCSTLSYADNETLWWRRRKKKWEKERVATLSLKSSQRRGRKIVSDYVTTTAIDYRKYSLEAVSDSFWESECDGERQLLDYLSVVLGLLILLSCCRGWLWQPANRRHEIGNKKHIDYAINRVDIVTWIEYTAES